MIFNDGEEYIVVGIRNLQISFGQKMIIFLNVYYMPCMEFNLLSVNQIMQHNPQLDVNFRNQKCYIVYKTTENIVALSVKDHGLFKLVDIG
jgi:hypothetical protein